MDSTHETMEVENLMTHSLDTFSIVPLGWIVLFHACTTGYLMSYKGNKAQQPKTSWEYRYPFTTLIDSV